MLIISILSTLERGVSTLFLYNDLFLQGGLYFFIGSVISVMYLCITNDKPTDRFIEAIIIIITWPILIIAQLWYYLIQFLLKIK